MISQTKSHIIVFSVWSALFANEVVGSAAALPEKALTRETDSTGPKVEPVLTIPAKDEAFEETSTGMRFVFVKGGCYEMGNAAGDGRDDEKPVHEVCVGDFAIGKYEVTRGQFRKFAEETGYRTEAERGDGCFGWTGRDWEKRPVYNWRGFGIMQDDLHPVACVSWNDAVTFADWLTAREGKTFRLPTEAEWEYAARSGGKNEMFSGDDDPMAVGWYNENSEKRSHRVGQKKPNSLGIHDMSGNVWEWVRDWYDKEYYRHSTRIDPKGPFSGTIRVGRGGSWYGPAQHARTINRSGNNPDGRIGFVGFRLVSHPQIISR